MKAAKADTLKAGDTAYAAFGGHYQECKVLRVVKEQNCRRIYVRYRRKDGAVCEDKIRHQSAFV